MPSPVLPSDFEAVIPLPADTACERFRKTFLKFPVLLYRWFRWAFSDDGNFTDQHKAMLCDCAPPPTTTTTVTTTTTTT